ncbi:ABC transporter permease [Lysinibacillus sp. SGAir0095]|uniref:ABC transporter permease n=1 Tax=Lysinibacillus sp. SGAir0095 TaxID=2070463 RepID=UPI0010CCE210|nr:ABC transporter permease [Lysinibacillus sp. SGAir0095]QCR32358.1 ABC transporter permease [Lysinibacillus sp. SGAir0095]
MITGQLERAFQLAEKHKLDVSTILELNKIIMKEVNSSPKTEEKILQQILQILENNKQILREAT